MAISRSGNRGSSQTESSRPGGADWEVLLIEDQRSLAQMAAKMLYERWGCHVLIATTLEQVRSILSQNKHRFFVAVSDLNLPDAPDGEVIDELKAAKIPVIAVTGNFDDSLQEDIMGKGVIDYVLKDSINAYEYIVELVGRLFKNTRIKVLVIDDSPSFRDILAHMLRMQCLQVVTAADGAEGIESLEYDRDIKLVLVDHAMPVMDGFTFLATLRRKLGKDRLAVIGISASENKRMSAQFLKLGANDFISKPFSYEELACRISQNLEMQESIETMRFAAFHDYLTGLYNRRYFYERGGKLFEEAAKAGKPLVVAMIDIDSFKNINDTYGHDGGDTVLRHLGAMLKEYFTADLVARVGGEEFLLLSADAVRTAESCEALRQQVAKSPAGFGATVIPYTVSIGIASQLQASLDATLKVADDNLYQAKQSGRNCIVAS